MPKINEEFVAHSNRRVQGSIRMLHRGVPARASKKGLAVAS
jgi:hypothetical protein